MLTKIWRTVKGVLAFAAALELRELIYTKGPSTIGSVIQKFSRAK